MMRRGIINSISVLLLLSVLHTTSAAFLFHSRRNSFTLSNRRRHVPPYVDTRRLLADASRRQQQQHEHEEERPQSLHNVNVTEESLLNSNIESPFRRQVLLSSLATCSAFLMLHSSGSATAAYEATTTTSSTSLLERVFSQVEKSKQQQQSSGRLYVVSAKKNVTISPQRTPLDEAIPASWGVGDNAIDRLVALSSQICLLRLLPVKNVFFRSLETNIVRLSAVTLQTGGGNGGGGGAPPSVGGGSTTTISSSSSTSTSSTTATAVSSRRLMTPKTPGVPPREDWAMATQRLVDMINEIDSKRSLLAPVFNPQDSTLLAISKGERGEQLIESLRTRLSEMTASTQAKNVKLTLRLQKQALLALSEIGELLVTTFPYDVPRVGKFSYLPRLLGRARVTFTMMRPTGNSNNNNYGGSGSSINNSKILGNITIVADGYAAPITAGNFVDLSARQFYTGLPIQFCKKKLGDVNSKSPTTEFDVASLPIFGSFQQEGFYDPLTAKPRRIPLEIIRVEKSTGLPSLTYYPQGLPSLLTSKTSSSVAPATSTTTTTANNNNTAFVTETNNTTATAAKPPVVIKASTTGKTVLEPTSYSEPLLTFNIPGLVAMNHPDNYPNGASAEFFALQDSSIIGVDNSINSGNTDSRPDKRRLLDGEYAPFGYIVEGYDLFQHLQPNDVIEATTIDEWGLLNLVKIRQSSFAQVLESASDENNSVGTGPGAGSSNTANSNAAGTY